MKYFTRMKIRRVYEWSGKPRSFNRRLKTYDYDSFAISVEGLSKIIINTGQHILIEGYDEDNPYVAKTLTFFVLCLSLPENGQQMKAVVQWFMRVSELPVNKLKLLGRDPHPQEIFYYEYRNCDNEVNVESILRPVKVKHLDSNDPFPDSSDKDTLYVKLSWDSKVFGVVNSTVMESPAEPAPASSPPSCLKPSLPISPSCSQSAATPRGPSRRVLPTPDHAIMQKASLGEVGCSSVGTPANVEAESLHSATKLSASKCLSAKRRNATARTPGVRKRLELSTTTVSQKKELKTIKEPVLSVLAEVENEKSPMVTETPRSSKRKSAMLVSSRIKKQLNLLENHQDLNSSGEEEDEFVPSKNDLLSSSEEEGQDEDGPNIDDQVTAKKFRYVATGSRSSRSKQKSYSSARTQRRTPAKKISPGTPKTPRHATPSIPIRSLQTQQPANILEEARTRLHVSSVPESLPCREQEFQDIYSFVESKIIDNTGGCMYISGVPGTGKTATVHEVIRCLQHAADMDEIPSFHFIEINGMKMTDPHQAYVQILQKLTGQKATPDHAAVLLEKRFSNLAPRKETIVLLVDELDLLWTRKQNVMYNLFDWPTRRHARLVVLTIANTMDLPERILINRVASRLGLTRMSFQPYSFKQLQEIIMSRLNKLKAFEEDALQLASRKVAALSGDARRCLDICRRATEICEHSAADPSSAGLVGMSHVMEALNEMFSSAYITAIRCASTQEQLFLRAVIAEFRRLGLEEATFQQVFVQHQALCRIEGLRPIGVSEGLAVCQHLGACRLLLLEPSHLGVLQRIRLNVSQDDIFYALKAD
ncbi:origin recognition complex subunit 1 [Neolamprologus brichardi]|uniref:origin recognition complex subunit 1 n=1 Tax=Neolamprologus brichardi TaxID=32507 RepID=UPI0003EBDF3A|nr:origin recognition complex subunit 1 [Neolamprologus brichardi]